MRLLGLDVGEKTIGIAVSDPLGWFAQGVETYRRKDEESDLAYLHGLVKQYEAAVVVIGLPLNMNGSEGPSALRARRLGELLNERVSIQTEYQDERLSTVAAE
ncbi:MAG: Holliday junction resolvase RuvX, partial [Clostridia bacterium]|nr:Holliday junction resolvase RuvX [Clostridia bacterium]